MDQVKVNEAIRDFLLEAGAHALKIQKNIDCRYKKGQQAVTQADLDISHMATEKLSYWLEQDDHVLIDEESVDTIAAPEDVFKKTRYQWVLDPVDGTAGYALGRDRWGISLGLMEEGVPVGGGFYMPALGALVLMENGQATCTNVTTGEKTPMPMARSMDVNSQIFVESYIGLEGYWGAGAEQNRAWINTPESALQGGYSTLMGQAAGMSFFEGFSIWDMVGIAAIANATGFKFMAMDDGRLFERFTGENYNENWKLKGRWILSHPDNYQVLRYALTGK